MSPTIRVWGGAEPGEKEPPQVFISIEDIPVVLSDLRRYLPELTEKLRGKWPVGSVHIEQRSPRMKNPIEPSQVVVPACMGLVVTFTYAAAKAAGTKAGDAIGDYVIRRIRARFEKWRRLRGSRGRGTKRGARQRTRRT